MEKTPKIIIWDIETSPIVSYTWNLFPKYLSHDNIVEDWFIICGAWKELGSKKVEAVSIKKLGDDYEVVKKLRDTLADADIIVHHYGDKFDLKKLNARLIYHGLQPLPKIHTVDTKKEASKIASFSSNRLDYLSKYLIGEGKIHVDFNLWVDIMKGSKSALKEMVQYNKVDVIRCEEVYVKLRPYMKNHPHSGVIAEKPRFGSCKCCGSERLKKNGIRTTAAGIRKQEVQCKDCNSYSLIPIV
jgi:DNA polymerase elongation subunit (family B)